MNNKKMVKNIRSKVIKMINTMSKNNNGASFQEIHECVVEKYGNIKKSKLLKILDEMVRKGRLSSPEKGYYSTNTISNLRDRIYKNIYDLVSGMFDDADDENYIGYNKQDYLLNPYVIEKMNLWTDMLYHYVLHHEEDKNDWNGPLYSDWLHEPFSSEYSKLCINTKEQYLYDYIGKPSEYGMVRK